MYGLVAKLWPVLSTSDSDSLPVSSAVQTMKVLREPIKIMNIFIHTANSLASAQTAGSDAVVIAYFAI